MDLKDFRGYDLHKDQLYEFRMRDSEHVRVTKPLYFLGLTEELPEEYRTNRPDAPFVTLAQFKDKNHCSRGKVDIPLEDILQVL